MKKKSRSLYYIILMLFLQVFCVATPVNAISEEKKEAVSSHCEIIRDNLKEVQRADSRMRVYLGRYYETLLTRFMVPLNFRLVDNSLAETGLINNQSMFNDAQADFKNDYIEYQKGLEDLVAFDCKAEPERFYEKLVSVRKKRAIVANDTERLGKFASEQVLLVRDLEARLAGGLETKPVDDLEVQL